MDMADSKLFKLEDGMTAETIGIGVEGYLREKKNLIAEGMKTPEGYLVQGKEESKWKKIAGLDQATQVQIFQSTPDTITVNVGTGKWVDKAASAGVGAVVFAPLMATAAYGAFKQQKLPKEIFDFVENFILTGGRTASVSMGHSLGAKEQGKVSCPKCHALNDKGMKFCSSCGTELGTTCPNCKETVDLGTKFCPHCGTNIEEASEQHCSNCGNVMEADAKFCPECGTPA
jgi:RNA polymerase subunit RPABC4/transcription elongation factor Spt4